MEKDWKEFQILPFRSYFPRKKTFVKDRLNQNRYRKYFKINMSVGNREEKQ